MMWKRVAILAILLRPLCFGLQTRKIGRSDTSSSCTNLEASEILDRKELRQAIKSGCAFIRDNFLTETQVKYLLTQIQCLEADGQFVTKGLSNTANQAQQFSKQQDRSICPVPWFQDVITMEHRQGARQQEQSFDSHLEIPLILRQLQLELATTLHRPTIADPALNHECYYSLSKIGSFLPRHMDERHEELKGAQGWLLSSRRSLSWLIYLSEPPDWKIAQNGGALRTFPQKQIDHEATTGSTHDGNLQVGWLTDSHGNSQHVYMDSFFQPKQISVALQEPFCILYIVNKQKKKEYLTKPWLNEALQGITVPEFIKACSAHDSVHGNESSLLMFQSQKYASQFHLLEDRQAWNEGHLPRESIVDDIAPLRGRLVVFDSVQLPHEVCEITSGTRRALAGWFHETTQELKL